MYESVSNCNCWNYHFVQPAKLSIKTEHHFIDAIHGNPGWADAMARILTKQLPDDKVPQL